MPTLLALAAVQIIVGVILFTMLGYVIYRQRKMEKIIMATNSGLTAETQAVTDLTTAVAALATASTGVETGLAQVLTDLKNITSEDPAVLAAAEQLETQITALNGITTALNAAAATVPPPPTPPAS